MLIVGLGAGLSIGSRILGGLALIYALVGFMPLFLEELRTQGARESIHRFVHVIYVLLPGLLLGYLVMGLIWPWSIMEPGNPFQAMTYFSHFFEKPWKEMFDGRAGVGARHALVVSPHPVRLAASPKCCLAFRSPASSAR